MRFGFWDRMIAPVFELSLLMMPALVCPVTHPTETFLLHVSWELTVIVHARLCLPTDLFLSYLRCHTSFVRSFGPVRHCVQVSAMAVPTPCFAHPAVLITVVIIDCMYITCVDCVTAVLTP